MSGTAVETDWDGKSWMKTAAAWMCACNRVFAHGCMQPGQAGSLQERRKHLHRSQRKTKTSHVFKATEAWLRVLSPLSTTHSLRSLLARVRFALSPSLHSGPSRAKKTEITDRIKPQPAAACGCSCVSVRRALLFHPPAACLPRLGQCDGSHHHSPSKLRCAAPTELWSPII
jgi:hypothetical protein